MRILFNVMTLNKGGAERVISILSNEFIRKNNIKIIANMKSKIDYEFNSKIDIQFLSGETSHSKVLRKLSRFSIKKILNLRKIIRDYNPDIIISFLPEPSLRVMLVKKIFKKSINCPIIISERNDPNTEYHNKLFNYVMRKLYPLADGFVFQTKDAQKYFENIISCKQKIILNPVDDSFINYKSKLEIRKKEIVTVGRLEKQKNQKLLIDAFKDVVKKHSDYILKIYGDGTLSKDIEKYIVTSNLNNKVFLMGNISNVRDSIKDSTLFVLCSNYEGLPNSLIEAMCLGIPCISTDCPCGGPRMLIENNKNGILIPINDKKALVDSIFRIIENKKLQGKLSSNCKKISIIVSKTSIVKEWISFIEEVKNK